MPAPPVTLVTVRVWLASLAGPALSFAVRSVAGNVRVTSSFAAFVSLPAVGASLTSSTWMVTVAVLDVPTLSVTRYVKVSVPAKSWAGM